MAELKTKEHHLTSVLNALDNQIEDYPIDEAIPPLANNFFWIISGSAGSGKTTMLLNLLKTPHKKGGLGKYYHKIFIISPTHSLDNKLEPLIKELGPTQCFNELNDENCENIMDQIKNDEKFSKEHFLVILDDCLGMLPPTVGKSKAHSLLISRRHLHCTIICSVQSYIRIPNLWRRNANLISFFHSQNRGEVDSLVDDINCDDELIRKLLSDATNKKHSFLTIRLGSGPPIFYKKFDRYLLENISKPEV